MIIWDTETTDLVKPSATPLKEQPKIIEFAGIKLCDKTFKELGRLEFLAHPGQEIRPEITKITGITNDDLKGQKPFSEHAPSVAEFFLGERYHFAHNIAFDMSVLWFELQRMDATRRFPWPLHAICTVEETFHIKGFRLNLTKLHNVCFGKDFPSAHRAMADVEALTKCVIWLLQNKHVELPAQF